MDKVFHEQLRNMISNPKAKQVYGEIRRLGTVTKFDLAEKTELKGTTLTRILEELLENNLILEAGFGFSTGGRKPILYRINPTFAYVLGLDLSRTYSKLVLCDLHLKVIDSVRWDMSEVMTPSIFLKHVRDTVQQLLRKNGVGTKAVLGMGIGSVGPLDREKGMILEPLYFPAQGWKNVSIVSFFEEALQIPVLLDNGANTAILGEYWLGDPSQHHQLVYIHIGVGLRSGMMSAGQIIYGATDMEGSIGQMIIQSDGLPPQNSQSGNYGALESYVTIQAIERNAKSKFKQGRETILRKAVNTAEVLDYHNIMMALRENDNLVVELFKEAAVYFGIGLANILNILHPEKIILGGPLITNFDLYYETAVDVAKQKTYYYPSYQPLFAKSELGEDGLAIGAAGMIINQLYE
jgi:predicted NBD/HSP70 family sugar kinase